MVRGIEGDGNTMRATGGTTGQQVYQRETGKETSGEILLGSEKTWKTGHENHPCKGDQRGIVKNERAMD